MNDHRLQCYSEIRDCMWTRVREYYEKHPELAGDARSKEAIKESVDGIDCILAILDKYELSLKAET